MKVDFIDLSAQYHSIKKEIDAAIAQTVENAAFIKGPAVKKFEADFAQYLHVENVLGCGNGTDALEIILSAMGIGPGDEVLVPAVSWISTSEVVITCGAQPVFVDIDPKTYTINPNLVEAKITKNTKAIIPVHLYGHPANMPKLLKIAAAYNLKVIEDCAQAHGAEINGKKVGGFGDAASFSFFPTKNLGAFGDAGAVIFKDKKVYNKAKMIANHGQLERHDHKINGRNSRLDGLQAAILSVKLKYLNKWIDLRNKKAAYYAEGLKEITSLGLPSTLKAYRHAFHLYEIQCKNREELRDYLAKHEIDSLIHYPLSLPFQECYKEFNFKPGDFPVAFQLQNEILSLPFYPELETEKMDFVIETLKNFFK